MIDTLAPVLSMICYGTTAPHVGPVQIDGEPCEIVFWPAPNWSALAEADRPKDARALSGGAYYLIRRRPAVS